MDEARIAAEEAKRREEEARRARELKDNALAKLTAEERAACGPGPGSFARRGETASMAQSSQGSLKSVQNTTSLVYSLNMTKAEKDILAEADSALVESLMAILESGADSLTPEARDKALDTAWRRICRARNLMRTLTEGES